MTLLSRYMFLRNPMLIIESIFDNLLKRANSLGKPEDVTCTLSIPNSCVVTMYSKLTILLFVLTVFYLVGVLMLYSERLAISLANVISTHFIYNCLDWYFSCSFCTVSALVL